MTIKQIYKNKDEEELLDLAPESAPAESALKVKDIPAVTVKSTGFDDSAYQATKPAYTNSYAGEIDSLMDSLENRQSFSYDPGNDPLYQQYESQYRREGSRAMEDTLAAASAQAGGMNSYAVSAAQQANNYYNAQLADRMPELAQLAYEMYGAEYDRDLDRLALLRSQENQEYDRYQDALSEWYTRLENAYQQYRDGVEDSRWRESFDYQKEQDALAYDQWLESLNYQKQQDAIDNAYRQESFDYGKQQDAIDNAYRQESFEYGKQQDAIDNAYRQEVFDYNKAQDTADPYSGTDDYQQAIEAARRGDRQGAEATLKKRAEKMADPNYTGSGNGTTMAEAYAYVERLLMENAAVEQKAVEYLRDHGYTENEVNGLISETAWMNQRSNYLRTGSGAAEVSQYDTYEDYVAAYIQYLSEQ